MDKKLSDMMLPAPVGGGFEMEGYWVWCGSVVKGEDDNYHMFASRWSKKYPMHPGWLVASEVVRASSKTPEGPYVFQEVVLPARGAEYWDGRSTHNPHI
ncbi:MAG: glycosyl hydrolase family 43, partial [Oscillospiraceae bacterium]